MIKLKNIYKTYISHNGVVHRALNNVSLDFEDKGFVVIVGRSGSGKTTLLNLLAGIDKCDRGQIIIENRSLSKFNQREFSSYRNSVIGYIFQDYNLIDAYNVYGNIKLSLLLQSRKNPELIKTIMDKLEIEDLKRRKNYQLSGGQKQRVAIARALIKDPKVILADEPSGALDEKTTVEIFDIFKELSKTKLVIVITHDFELAQNYADRIIEIKDGQIFKDFAINQEAEISNPEFIAKSIYYFPANHKIEEAEMNELNKEFKENIQDYYLSVEQSPLKVKTMFPEFKEVFEHDSATAKKYHQYQYQEKEPSELELKKSNLPFLSALKLSFHNIWKKKFTFSFLLIISVFLISLFGVSSNLDNYNYEYAYAYAIQQNNLSRYVIENGQFEAYRITSRQKQLITKNWQKIANYYTPILTLNCQPKPFEIFGVIETDYFSELYNFPFAFKSEKYFDDQNGIIISEYLADSIVKADDSLSNREELFDKEINLSNVMVRIVGIYTYDYQELQEITDLSEYDLELNYQMDLHLTKVFFKHNGFQNLYQNLYPNYANIKIGFLENFIEHYSNDFIRPISQTPQDKLIKVEEFNDNFFYASLDDLQLFLNQDISQLNTNEISDLISEFNQSNNKVILSSTFFSQILHAHDQIKISGFINDSEITSSYISDDIYQKCLTEYYLPSKVYVERTGESLSLAKEDIDFMIANSLCITNRRFISATINLASIESFESFLQYYNFLIFILLVVLLYFFLSLSIKKNRRQIGILRAAGANFIDIVKIFILEAVIIGAISITGGLTAFDYIGNFINRTINKGIYTPIILNNFSTYFRMVFVTLAVIPLALILPIIKIIRTKIINLL